MPSTMTTMQAIMKSFYIGPVRENLNNSKVLLAQLKKSSKEVVGEQVVIPLHIGRNWGIGARGTSGNGTLPTARNQQYTKAYFTTKDIYGTVAIRGKTLRATKTDQGAFLRAVTAETKGMTDDLANDINRQLYGSGNGVLCTISSGATSATQTVTSTQYLEAGMYLDIDNDTAVQIASVDSATQITLTGSITTVTNDTVRLTGVGATDELNGLDLITANSGTLHNIDPATFSIWKGNVFGSDASPVALTEDQMQQAVDQASKGGGDPDFIVTSYEGRRKLLNLLSDMKRFVGNQTGKLKGGFEYIDFNGIPVAFDRHCQSNSTATRYYFLTLDSLGIYRMADFDWMQEDGNILARQVGSGATETYEATLVCDMEFGCSARRHNSVLKGVAV